MKTSILVNYTFDKAAKTVTFTDFPAIELNRILSITDMTNGIQIYSYRINQYTGSVSGNVLTLKFDTNNANFNNSDKLYIEYITDNYSQEIQSSAAKTTTFNGADITNYDAKGASFIINVSAVSGTTPGMIVKVQAKDVTSGNYIDIPLAVSTSITTTGLTMLTVYPGITNEANAKVDFPLPRVYRLVYTISGITPSLIFSVTANYIN